MPQTSEIRRERLELGSRRERRRLTMRGGQRGLGFGQGTELFFPAILIRARPMSHNKISGGFDVLEPRAPIVSIQLIRKYKRPRLLIHL